EMLLFTARADDPSLNVIKKTIETKDDHPQATPRIVIAGEAVDCGQKVHNLRAAVAEVDTRSEARVFVDSDPRPASDWLRKLVGPLQDEGVGAATGYRWFITRQGGVASH